MVYIYIKRGGQILNVFNQKNSCTLLIEILCNIIKIYVILHLQFLKYKMLQKIVCVLVRDEFVSGGHVMVRAFEYLRE